MKWRIIIKISLEDRKSKLRKPIEQCLKNCCIEFNKNSGTWEGSAVNPKEAAEQLNEVFKILSEAVPSKGIYQTCLNHLWIYIDRVA